jgi:protein-disulfide isomerase
VIQYRTLSGRSGQALLVMGIGMLALGACKGQAPAGEQTAPAVVPAAEAPTADAKPTAEAPAEPAKPGDAAAEATACNDFADQVCKAAGDTAEACTATRTVATILPPKACVAAVAEVQYSIGKLGDMRKPCNELVDRLCKDLGEDTKTCAMVRSRTGQFPIAQCQSMTTDYEKVIGELRAMEARNKPLAAELVAKQQGTDAPSFGPADAKVTIVEYSDFECPYCSRAAATTKQIKEKYGDKVRVVFRQFPLSFHQNAMPAAQASLAAAEQGKFWEMHDKMFENQRALSREDLDKYATEIGLDMAKYKAAMDSGKFKDQVDADQKLGESVGVQGTPSMFLGAERIENPGDFDGLAAQIDAALAK